MKKLSKREKAIAWLCAAACVFFALKQGVFNGLVDYQDDQERRIKTTNHRISQARAVLRRRESFETKLRKLSDLAGTAAPEGVETSRLAARMEKAARSVDVRLVNVQPLPTRIQPFTRVFALETVVEGEWGGIVKFIYLVQEAESSLGIQEMTLEKYNDQFSALHGRIVWNWFKVNPR
jgi:hypothetical protein